MQNPLYKILCSVVPSGGIVSSVVAHSIVAASSPAFLVHVIGLSSLSMKNSGRDFVVSPNRKVKLVFPAPMVRVCSADVIALVRVSIFNAVEAISV